jgi:DNA invertase Pin-like site-specific DNA recombinase
MGCRPFIVATNDLLCETAPYYAQFAQDERRRKLRRIYKLQVDLKSQGTIGTTSPKRPSERDLSEIIGWFKGDPDVTTAPHYMRFLDEVLQSVGNNVVSRLKVKKRHLLPKPMVKSTSLIPSDSMDILLPGRYELDGPWWDAVSRAAIAICAHTELRSSELRLSRLADIDLERMEICVCTPKGMARWANGTERASIMPVCEDAIRSYLERRRTALAGIGRTDFETLFPFISAKGESRFWSAATWAKLKGAVETASGVHFGWKDSRPTYAQTLKDANAPIEADEPQNPQNQLMRLMAYSNERGWDIAGQYVDKALGADANRPQLRQMLNDARARRLGLVLTTKIDRIARSSLDLKQIVAELEGRGIKFECTDQPFSTNTPIGKLLFGILGEIAEFERSLIVERTKAGLDRARAQGKQLGRPLKRVDMQRARGLRAQGGISGNRPGARYLTANAVGASEKRGGEGR